MKPGRAQKNVLWFSDVPGNVVRSVSPAGDVKVPIQSSGGITSPGPGALIGPNGMIADQNGAVSLCQHGPGGSCEWRRI